jgi:hypothetical protein
MPVDSRCKDVTWTIHPSPEKTVKQDEARLAVLMDIRDELKRQARFLDILRREVGGIRRDLKGRKR